jgi:hypothetical protein
MNGTKTLNNKHSNSILFIVERDNYPIFFIQETFMFFMEI